MKLVFILAVLVLLKTVILYRVYHLLPSHELKRRARARDAGSDRVYKVAAMPSFDFLIYTFGVAAAATLLIGAADHSRWLATIVLVLIGWLLFWSPRPRYGGPLWRFCVMSSPYVFKILTWLRPVLDPLARTLPEHKKITHTGAYEKEDLLALLRQQANQPDNRIPEAELKIAVAAIGFKDKKIAKTMRPRKSIKLVSEDEVVGPMLMDELHKTGQTDFPVVKGSAKASSPVITGTLYLKDVVEIGQENKGKVKDLMKPGACFINEACDLSQALDAVLKKHQHQLIVVNNFEEVVGAITLKDLIGQLLGEPLAHEFEAYENLHAVAGISAESSKHHEQKEEAKATEAVESPSEEPIATQAQ